MKSPSFSSASSVSSSAGSLSIGSSSSLSSSQAHDATHASQSNAPACLQPSAPVPGSTGALATTAAAPASDEVGSEPYERNFWASVFDESAMVDTLLGDEAMDIEAEHHRGDEHEMKHSPNAHAASHFDSSALDVTPSSALLDHWSHYDDDDGSMEGSMAELAAPPTMAPSSSLTLSSASDFSHAFTSQPQHSLANLLNDDSYRAFSKPSVDYTGPSEAKFTPAGMATLRSFAFESRSDGTPFALSKPVLRDDGILLVGTEHVDGDGASGSVRDKNRIFVTNVNATHPGQSAAVILVDSEVRDLHWMNHEAAIAAIGCDIHLIRIGAASGNYSCFLQPPIPRVHSDAIRELALHTGNSLVLSGGFDETVVVTDLVRTSDPTDSAVVSKFDAHDVVSSVRWSPDESQLSWTTDGGDFQIGDARARSPQLKVPLDAYLRVDAMGGLFTHEYLNAHKVVLGFERNHLVYIDTRMPRDSCCYAVTKSPMGTTGEIRRAKTTNKFAVFGLGGFTTAELSLNTKSQEVLKLRQYVQSSSTAYKTSGDYSFESNRVLTVSDNAGTVTIYNDDADARVLDASVLDSWKEERTV